MENSNYNKNMWKCAHSHTLDIYGSSVVLDSYFATDQNVKGSMLLDPTATFSDICPKKVSRKSPDTRMLS